MCAQPHAGQATSMTMSNNGARAPDTEEATTKFPLRLLALCRAQHVAEKILYSRRANVAELRQMTSRATGSIEAEL